MSEKQKHELSSYYILGVFVALNVVMAIAFSLPVLDLAVSITGVAYMAVLSKRSVFNFLVSIINVLLYVVICFNTRLYGEVILYLAFDIPMTFIAFFSWRKVMDKALTVNARILSNVWLIVLPIVLAIFTLFYGLFLKHIGGEFVFIDALSTGITIVATLLLWKRFREQWYGWIMVYAVSITMWVMAGNLLMITMSAGCLIFSVTGLIEWRRNSCKLVDRK